MTEYTWIPTPVDAEKFKKFKSLILENLNFGPSWKTRSVTRKYLEQAGLEYVSDEAAGSVRSVIMRTYMYENVIRIKKNIKEITKSYNDNISIIDIAVKWRYPPLNLLRSILIQNGKKESDMHKVFNRIVNASKYISGRDLKQYIIASADDAESSFDDELISAIAKYNENQITSYFMSNDVPIITEAELVEEQVEKYGRALHTPDIVFKTPIVINGIKIHWLDYKDYMGCPDSILYDSNIKQSSKYNAIFGNGALLYHYGFVSMTIPGTLLLDASSLDIRLFG
jgi:hypothetical protein